MNESNSKKESETWSTLRSSIGLSFDDVLLEPQKGVVKSRDDVNLTTKFISQCYLLSPIISSPMPSVTEWKMARAMSEVGGFGFIHRFMSVDNQVKQYKKATERRKRGKHKPVADTHWAGCAIGINEGYGRLEQLYKAGCRYFCVDIAHGYSEISEKFVRKIPREIKFASTFISGSVATGEAAHALAELGFDGIRVGIGNGSACSTREKTGFGVPQLTAIMDCSNAVKGMENDVHEPITIIACGGIRTSADIVKALAAGSNSVLVGRLFAGSKESPKPGEYYGAASEKAGKSRYIEGSHGVVERSGSVRATIESLHDGIRSGISYSGGRNIRELQAKATFRRVAAGVSEESATRL